MQIPTSLVGSYRFTVNLSETETPRSSHQSTPWHYDKRWDNDVDRTIWNHDSLVLTARSVTNSYWYWIVWIDLSLSNVWWFLSFHSPLHARNKCQRGPSPREVVQIARDSSARAVPWSWQEDVWHGSWIYRTNQNKPKIWLGFFVALLDWWFFWIDLFSPHAYKTLQNRFVDVQHMQFTSDHLYQPALLQPPVFVASQMDFLIFQYCDRCNQIKIGRNDSWIFMTFRTHSQSWETFRYTSVTSISMLHHAPVHSSCISLMVLQAPWLLRCMRSKGTMSTTCCVGGNVVLRSQIRRAKSTKAMPRRCKN